MEQISQTGRSAQGVILMRFRDMASDKLSDKTGDKLSDENQDGLETESNGESVISMALAKPDGVPAPETPGVTESDGDLPPEILNLNNLDSLDNLNPEE